MVERFPGTNDPIPPLLTALEAVKVLRLDVSANGDGAETVRAPGDAIRSLRHLVHTKQLRPRQFGKSQTFSRSDILHLIRDGPPS